MNRFKDLLRIAGLFVVVFSTYGGAIDKISNDHFTIAADNTGITSLTRTNDKYNTNYIIDKGTLSDVVIACRTDLQGQWTQMSRASLVSSNNESIGYKIIPDGQSSVNEQIDVRSTFRLKADSLFWTIDIKNLTDKPMEVGDVGIPLRLNTQYQYQQNSDLYSSGDEAFPHSG